MVAPLNAKVMDVVRAVGQLGVCTQRQICDATGLTQGVVSWLLARAKSVGLVTTLPGQMPMLWFAVEGWEAQMQAINAKTPGHPSLDAPAAAIDWLLIYHAWGIYPPHVSPNL